ncbi:DUF3137 domain-containing protein [Marivirga harenae]|uniref:DUF3137 domain-containing protein n=1 Tax=Marivirga harenae TaxID=2010992 RepID=UPI0026DF0168|nr:DUF3137 domain-containing protein [Marivirga harenae]WKV11990.1 DUF3137 domain-containing protein [Marivirga harenae]
MQSKLTFDQFYEKKLIPEIEKQEDQRKKYKRKFLTALLIGYIIYGIIVVSVEYIYFHNEDQNFFIAYVFCGILLIVPYIFFFQSFRRKFALVYKNNVIRKMIHFIDNGLSYSPTSGFSKSQYLRSELFKRRPDRYKAEDLVQGTIGQTPICFSEIKSEYKSTSGSGKNRKTQWHTIFDGIFFEADFNKDFKTKTFILPDYLERSLGFIGKKLQSLNVGRPPLVKLEDPEFEKYFAVYGEDQVEARYILSTSLMQRLTEFGKKRSLPIYISFVDNSIFVAIYESKNLFEPRIFRTNVNKDVIFEYFDMLKLVTGIVEDLNLNNRIWAGSKMK